MNIGFENFNELEFKGFTQTVFKETGCSVVQTTNMFELLGFSLDSVDLDEIERSQETYTLKKGDVTIWITFFRDIDGNPRIRVDSQRPYNDDDDDDCPTVEDENYCPFNDQKHGRLCEFLMRELDKQSKKLKS